MALGSRTVLCLLLAGSALASGCAPLLFGGVVTAGVVSADRRTSGAQLEDQAIELKASSAYKENLTGEYHINTNSYNRQVLLTGEVETEKSRVDAERAMRQVPNVRNVFNELRVMPSSTLTQRSNDTLITGHVRSRVVGTDDLPSNSLKITTERNTVYLQGLVTQREAALATEVARTTSAVDKVVRVFEYISESELRARQEEREARVPVVPVTSNGGQD